MKRKEKDPPFSKVRWKFGKDLLCSPGLGVCIRIYIYYRGDHEMQTIDACSFLSGAGSVLSMTKLFSMRQRIIYYLSHLHDFLISNSTIFPPPHHIHIYHLRIKLVKNNGLAPWNHLFIDFSSKWSCPFLPKQIFISLSGALSQFSSVDFSFFRGKLPILNPTYFSPVNRPSSSFAPPPFHLWSDPGKRKKI